MNVCDSSDHSTPWCDNSGHFPLHEHLRLRTKNHARPLVNLALVVYGRKNNQNKWRLGPPTMSLTTTNYHRLRPVHFYGVRRKSEKLKVWRVGECERVSLAHASGPSSDRCGFADGVSLAASPLDLFGQQEAQQRNRVLMMASSLIMRCSFFRLRGLERLIVRVWNMGIGKSVSGDQNFWEQRGIFTIVFSCKTGIN